MPGVFLKKPRGFGCRVGTQSVVAERSWCGRPVVDGGSLLCRTHLRNLSRYLGSDENFFDSSLRGVFVDEQLTCFAMLMHVD